MSRAEPSLPSSKQVRTADTASHLTSVADNRAVAERQIPGINAFFGVAMAAGYLVEFRPIVGL